MTERAIFLDRDDTLITDPGYLNHPDQVRLIDGVSKPLAELKSIGYKLIVATNQSAVAKGIITEKVLGDIHQRLGSLLSAKGAGLDAIYYCPYHPEGVIPKYRRESEDRKPNPGMIVRAAREMDIDLSESWLIGNSDRDIQAGQRAGCRTILIVKRSRFMQTFRKRPKPDFEAVNMKEAVNIIKKHRRTSSKSLTKPPSGAAEPPKETRRTRLSRRRSVTREKEPVIVSTGNEEVEKQSTEQLLEGIFKELKTTRRVERFGQFSLGRLIAGIVQIVVFFCLLISILLMMEPDRQNELVLIALGFAIVLQLMVLSFYIMQGRR